MYNIRNNCIGITIKYYRYDFVLTDIKICIEFNGNCFHANPNLYKKDDTPNPYNKLLTSESIWLQDKIKTDLIKNQGYMCYNIWESDEKNEDIFINIINTIKEKYKDMNEI
jgi:very-short-patch-repair endonuclease